jgi:hypothetical protein
MKNSNETIRNRTRDLPAYSAVPQQTVPPHIPRSEAVVSRNSDNPLLQLANYIRKGKKGKTKQREVMDVVRLKPRGYR